MNLIMNPSPSMQVPDCFKTLRVSPGAQWQEIKKSYHSLAKQFHPDRNPGNRDSEDRFKKLHRAFKTLEYYYQIRRDIRTRSRDYDKRQTGPSTTVNFESPEPSSPGPPISFQELIKGFRNKASWIQAGRSIRAALENCERKILLLDIKKNVRLDAATASRGGFIRVQQGSDSFQVPAPSGSWNRMSLRIPGKGDPGLFSRKRGDLWIHVEVIGPKPPVHSQDANIYYDFNASIQDILQGKVFTLQSVEGPIKFFLPKTTRDGQVFTLKSNKTFEGRGPSNHIVTVRLD